MQRGYAALKKVYLHWVQVADVLLIPLAICRLSVELFLEPCNE